MCQAFVLVALLLFSAARDADTIKSHPLALGVPFKVPHAFHSTVSGPHQAHAAVTDAEPRELPVQHIAITGAGSVWRQILWRTTAASLSSDGEKDVP